MSVDTQSELEKRVSSIMNSFGVTTGDHEKYSGVVVGESSHAGRGTSLEIFSPIDGARIGQSNFATIEQLRETIEASHEAFKKWRLVPAPIRGEFVRRVGNELREFKEDLSILVTIECGKILEEARGEVQEMIDICDFAVGLSRQLYGKTMPSERPAHRLTEQWHPLGPIGIISAFNFPVAVWAWNAMIGLVCGDTLIWKPSEKTPLTALACQAILNRVAANMSEVPNAVSGVVVGGPEIGHEMATSSKLPLISATGSVGMGKSVAQAVGARLGRSILELGGNNASIICKSADVEMALRGVVFAAAGTCGQRCTSLRRLIIDKSLAENFTKRIQAAFENLRIGNPLEPGTLVGPLIDRDALSTMEKALDAAIEQGGTVIGGQRIIENVPGGYYVRPAIVKISRDAAVVQRETFAPILYVIQFEEFAEAIEIQNEVPQGLSSSVFTKDVREAELFVSVAGSDCGIANVNIGTSGAEIGGAFGGEKETGGGRESGSDSWKAYMRRATNTVNYSDQLPLAQGIKFDL